MATRVTCVVLDRSDLGERIDAVGGPDWTKDTDTVIGEITEGREYFVAVDLARVRVVVAERHGRPYLRTDPDESPENGLFSLPLAPARSAAKATDDRNPLGGHTMSATTTTISPTAALADLDRVLDLTDIRSKLADPEQGPGLTVVELDGMEAEYRKFLALQLAHPQATIVPCGVVDRIWHQHILDTAAYRADCEAIFGRFLDHYPYFGMRSEHEAEELADAYAETLDLYHEAFGEPPPATWLSADGAARCRKQCKPMKCR